MEPKNIIQVSTRAELRQWFEQNHASCTEMWLRVKRGNRPEDGVVSYVDAVMDLKPYAHISTSRHSFLLIHIDCLKELLILRACSIPFP